MEFDMNRTHELTLGTARRECYPRLRCKIFDGLTIPQNNMYWVENLYLHFRIVFWTTSEFFRFFVKIRVYQRHEKLRACYNYVYKD